MSDQAQDTIKQLTEALRQALAAQTPQSPDRLYVGIRNVSSDVIGIPTRDGDVLLHADIPGQYDPESWAVISYQTWQVVRKGPLYRFGLIERDDAVLGPVHGVAPEDRPQDLAWEHANNTITDPVAFIEQTPEKDMRERMGKITSEFTLRRLLGAVDAKIRQLQGSAPLPTDDAHYEKSKQRVEDAINNLPGCYTVIEKLALKRLEDLDDLDHV